MPTSGGYPRCAVINKENNKELLALETSYISLIVPQYNILTEAGNSFGYKHSEENLLKMKLAFTEERKELLRQLQYKRKGL
jgi:excinuclease UvrABC nuclease subunit